MSVYVMPISVSISFTHLPIYPCRRVVGDVNSMACSVVAKKLRIKRAKEWRRRKIKIKTYREVPYIENWVYDEILFYDLLEL